MYKEVIDLYLGNAKEDPIKKINEEIEDLSYFIDNETGMYNKSSSSIVKLKDNGVIDIFAGTNQGIRIDPERRVNNFFSLNENHYLINCEFNIQKEFSLNIKRNLKVKALRADINCNRDSFSIDGITMKNMDDTIAKNALDIIELNKELSETKEEVYSIGNNLLVTTQETSENTSSINLVINRLAQAETMINILAQRIEALEGGE